MSFYKNLLATLAAAAVISPVFAGETTNQTQSGSNQAAGATQQQPTTGAQQSTQGKTNLSSNESASAKINLNKATVKELLTVKGVNKSQARAIVAYRKKHGDFKSLDELNNVRTLKKKPLDKASEEQLSIQ